MRVDMGQIGSDSRSVDDVEKSEMLDEMVLLEEKTEWLTDASRSPEECNLKPIDIIQYEFKSIYLLY